jgi:hypothetical protein
VQKKVDKNFGMIPILLFSLEFEKSLSVVLAHMGISLKESNSPPALDSGHYTINRSKLCLELCLLLSLPSSV